MATVYLDNILNPKNFKRTSSNLIKMIRKSKLEFDAIAFQGNSGAMIAPYIASVLSKGTILVRKEKSHSSHLVEYTGEYKKYIIIDDFIDTGKTIREIVDKIGKDNSTLVGVFLYSSFENPWKDGFIWNIDYKKIIKEYKVPIYNYFYLENGKYFK